MKYERCQQTCENPKSCKTAGQTAQADKNQENDLKTGIQPMQQRCSGSEAKNGQFSHERISIPR